MGADRARELRKKMTPPERRLWNVLRRRPEDFKFRRQHPFGTYTLDFFCCEAALCVEIDGLAHELGSNPRRDLRRDQWLSAQGIRTLRIAALDVRDNLEGVIEYILESCRQRSPSTAPLVPLPSKSRGGERMHQIKACELNLVGYEDEDEEELLSPVSVLGETDIEPSLTTLPHNSHSPLLGR